MGQMPPRDSEARAKRLVIQVPRPGDAVGGALRGAYARDRAVPEDMLALLSELDAWKPARH